MERAGSCSRGLQHHLVMLLLLPGSAAGHCHVLHIPRGSAGRDEETVDKLSLAPKAKDRMKYKLACT